MSKPMTYWGCDENLNLIQYIASTWGWDLRGGLVDSDRAFLIWQLALEVSNPLDTSNSFDLVYERITERGGQKFALIQALVNKSDSKPLGYWGLQESPIVDLIRDVWGEYLLDMCEEDRYALLYDLARAIFREYPEQSFVASEVIRRIEELPTNQICSLIRALGN
jgi:hypothetical protein